MAPRADEPRGPRTFFIRDTYAEAREQLLTFLQSQRWINAQARIKGGTIMTTTDRTVAATYSKYTDSVGRRLISQTVGVATDEEVRRRADLLGSLRVHREDKFALKLDDPIRTLDCISLSDLSESAFVALADELLTKDLIEAAASWSSEAELPRLYLWDRLPLTAVLSAGVLLTSVEDGPAGFGADEHGRTYVIPASSPTARDSSRGQFYEFDDIIPEKEFVGYLSPADLPTVRRDSSSVQNRQLSPVLAALSALGSTTTRRISSYDDRSVPGWTRFPPTPLQFPDYESVLGKVRTYCLLTLIRTA